MPLNKETEAKKKNSVDQCYYYLYEVRGVVNCYVYRC